MYYHTFDEHIRLVRANREAMRRQVLRSSRKQRTKDILIDWIDGKLNSEIAREHSISRDQLSSYLFTAFRFPTKYWLGRVPYVGTYKHDD